MNKLLLLTSIFLFISCSTTQSLRKVPVSEVPNYINLISNKEDVIYRSYWVQPSNKTEPCELLMEGYSLNNNSIENIQSESLTWDGRCKNGKTHGLGKMTVEHGSVDSFEIAYHNLGITDQYFYKSIIGSNKVDFGAYVRENYKMVKLLTNKATIKNDQSIDNIYAVIEENLKDHIAKGWFKNNYTDGSAKLIGIFGSKLFFGKREVVYNKGDKLNYINYGFFDVHKDKPELYFIHQDKQKTHHIKINTDNSKEFVHLPPPFINDVTKIPEDAAQIARTASNAGEMALVMKKKYERLNQSPEKSSFDKKPILSNTISTGTGFFISNDGVLLTNSHVIENASKVSVIFNNKKVDATVLANDTINDIALLKISGITRAIPLETNNKTKKGSDISILGYPNIGLQGNEQKATFGYINSNSGLKGDLRFYQISAPIQAGNSGSPVLNDNGSVVGIATSTLNQSAALKATGNLVQNVNYAIKITYALPLLISKSVKYNQSKLRKINKTKLIDKISDSVVLVVAE
jgi:S1-C subfamily serine protease